MQQSVQLGSLEGVMHSPFGAALLFLLLLGCSVGEFKLRRSASRATCYSQYRLVHC